MFRLLPMLMPAGRRRLAKALLALFIGLGAVGVAAGQDERGEAPGPDRSSRPRLRGRELDIEQCLRLAMLYNKNAIKAREEITRLGGERIVNRSRFLPQVSYVLRSDTTEQDTDDPGTETTTDNENKIKLTQRLFEFGKDAADDIALRKDQREALYNLEDTIRDALYSTRLNFYRALLKQQQIDSRRLLLKEFQEKYETVKARYEKKMVLEVDQLTARLDVLNEERQINDLETDANTLRMQLMQQIGNPIGAYRVRLKGEYKPFAMSADECVETGLKNSTAVSLAREKVDEQRRLIGRLVWDFAPSLSLSSGAQTSGNTAAFTIAEDEDKVWAGQMELQRYFIVPEDGISDFSSYISAKHGWFVSAEVTFPIFQGMKRRGRYQSERAALRKLLTDIEIQRDSVELDIRSAYQTLLQRQRNVEIQTETVRISLERWQIKEKLKAIGRVTDDEVETFRNRYFNDQVTLFSNQDQLVQAQESLRRAMRYFE